ncbi:MAG: hypothetical protein QNL05_00600 [Gammaproteobacteria bacterium]|nr:hypothetical protein [Gammaproteobacteria bacterium]MDX2485981.1 hypothetical protein [Gammaproteobacteria bacterium]
MLSIQRFGYDVSMGAVKADSCLLTGITNTDIANKKPNRNDDEIHRKDIAAYVL